MAIPVAVAMSAILVAESSYAAFAGTTDNPGGNWASGTVVLTDDSATTALFTVTGLKPGSAGVRCITVTSTSSLPAVVKLYGANYATTRQFSSFITLSVVQGTGGAPDCSGFTPLGEGASVYTGTLAGFGASAVGYASGVPATGAWAPTGAGPESRVYRFGYSVDPAAPNSVQSGTAALGFTWEAQNT